MQLVHFERYDKKGSISFVKDKIIGFVAYSEDEMKTMIYVGMGENDEFIVANNYGEVLAIMETA